MKKKLFIVNLFIIIASVLYGIFSGSIGYNYTKKQEGERLYMVLNVQFKDKILYQDIGFRYINLKFRLLGELQIYKDFVSKRGYSEMGENVYCKNENLITLHNNTATTIEFLYEYDSPLCK
ncbi:hypothetical protein [Rodentibacter myodis]|uniref:Uncharacterized protein n=1 Tax=Rodentibacter myodis TaxID=1907939 RepID=A0A1V3JR60_9PAST|nr:hypothetical protein [Rodentibacter myodis]OOF59099.1 hypothetical protein BKL49_06065 [Rodentibacter myodis]